MFNHKEDYGFVWKSFEIILIWLYERLPYRLLVKCLKAENYRSFADIFVLLYLIISVILTNIAINYIIHPIIMYVLLLYALYRMYEITIYALYTFFIIGYIKDAQRSKLIASSRRSLLFLLLNIFELTNIFIITGVFWLWKKDMEYFTMSYIDSFISNFYCFITFNTDALISKASELKYLAFIEVVIGVMFILLIISKFLSSIKPYNALEDENEYE